MAELKRVLLPDIGDFDTVDVVEIIVKLGDKVELEDSLIILESDKATVEIPSPYVGVIKDVKVTVGDKITEGALIALIDCDASAVVASVVDADADADADVVQVAEKNVQMLASAVAGTSISKPQEVVKAFNKTPLSPPGGFEQNADTNSYQPHASPSVRKFARELGADLDKIVGSGPKSRICKEDVQAYVKMALADAVQMHGDGTLLPSSVVVDFAKFGEIEVKPLTKIKRISGANLQRNWMAIPHVTQFDEADITELEAFRKSLANEAKQRNIKLTFLAFVVKAVGHALMAYPAFNSSLDATGENLIQKKYYHIGVAMDTPRGLVVPVLRDVDQKGLFALAEELAATSVKAHGNKLMPGDMQGGTFTVSSLGGLGGVAFTPIINAPEVAILGISRSVTKPVFKDGVFVPRLLLPLSLSYDHRVIDGAEAVRFITYLSATLADLRRILL